MPRTVMVDVDTILGDIWLSFALKTDDGGIGGVIEEEKMEEKLPIAAGIYGARKRIDKPRLWQVVDPVKARVMTGMERRRLEIDDDLKRISEELESFKQEFEYEQVKPLLQRR